MNRILLAGLLVASTASAHQQHIPDTQRQIKTHLSFAPVSVEISNTTEKEYTYQLRINGSMIGNQIVIAGNQSKTKTVYLTMPKENGANRVIKKNVCSEQLPNAGESIAFEVCHLVKVFYAQ